MVSSLRFLRRLLTLALVVLFIIWCGSFAGVVFARGQGLTIAGSSLLIPTDHTVSWRDTLILDVRIIDPGIQLRTGSLIWSRGETSQGQIPLRIRADGHVQRIIIPVGIHPQWRASLRDLRVRFAGPVMPQVRIEHAQLVTRPPWSLDALIGRLLMPAFLVVPPFVSLILLMGALLGGALALLWPWSQRRQRLALLAWGLGTITGAATIVAYAFLLAQLVPLYGARSEREAQRLTPAYNEQRALPSILLDAAPQLPDAPVLILDADPESYLVYRARALFYPRRVDVTIADRAPSRVAEVLQRGGYGGLIDRRTTARPPAPGWRRLGDPAVAPAIWIAPGVGTPIAPPEVGRWATALLVSGLLCVVLVGWACARWLAWGGLAAWVVAWPLGTMVLAWWMALLDASNVTWAWWSIGLPLGGIGLATLARVRAAGGWVGVWGAPPRPHWGWEVACAALLGLLAAGTVTYAVLMPFTDQDTWRMWALKGQAFFLDGEIAPVLALYPQSDMHHAAYPPAQPLLIAWGYLSMGGLSERLVKLVFPLWYIACVLLVWQASRQWALRRAASGWALLLATTPLMLDHAALGNADLPLATLWALSAVALVRWLDTEQPRWLWAGVLILSGAAWLKVDGQGIGAGIVLAAVLVRAVALRRQRRPLGPTLALGGVALLVFFLSLVPWIAVTRRLDLIDPTPGVSVLSAQGVNVVWEALRVMGEELLLSHNNSAWGLMGGGFGALWLIALGAVLVGWRAFQRDPGVWLLALIVGGTLAAYVGIYALRPFASIDRYVLHVAPVMVLLAARATRSAPMLLPVPFTVVSSLFPVPSPSPAVPDAASGGRPQTRWQSLKGRW